MQKFPTDEKLWLQTHDGAGNLSASFNIDLLSKPGRMRLSAPLQKAYNETDNSGFNSPIAKFLTYDAKTYAIGNDVFETSTPSTPSANWSDAAVSFQSTDWTETDGVVFDGRLLYTKGGEIRSFDGSSHANYWTTTLGQSALGNAGKRLLDVGPDGNLYITDGAKVYRVTPAESVSTSGAGTLDFSTRNFQETCMESNSSRLWIGMEHTTYAGSGAASVDGEGVVIEWDMGPQSISPNRIHPIGARAVRCLAIWNDTPIAVLSNGKIKYFNGQTFVDWKGAQFPVPVDGVLSSDFIHHNGWAIIDGLPHFLVKGSLDTSGDNYSDNTANEYDFPSAVWCLDPDRGLYPRFAIGGGESNDFGHASVSGVGALHSLETNEESFLASYNYYTGTSTDASIIAYNDISRSVATRGWFVTEWVDKEQDNWEEVRASFKKLKSGETINLYYRLSEDDNYPIILDGTWADTKHFHTTEDASNVVDGNLVLVKAGNGSGSLLKVTDVETSTGTYVLTTEEAVSGVTAEDTGTIEVLNFKKLPSITNTVKDWEKIAIPTAEKGRKIQLLVEIRQNASSTSELDYVIIE